MEARPLTHEDLAAARQLIRRSTFVNLSLASRLSAWPRAGALLVYPATGPVTALSGGPSAILMAAEASPEAGHAFGTAFRNDPVVHSITGPAAAVAAAWEILGERFGNGTGSWRDEIVMATSTPAPPELPRLPELRRATVAEVDSLMPAARAVFQDTNGLLPEKWGLEWSFRQSMLSLAQRGLAFAAFDNEGPTFKAEINLIWENIGQIKGVWVRPHLRGQGLGVAGMAALLDIVLPSIAPTATLRVDATNARALSVYRTIGFRQVGQARSVLAPPD